MHLSGSGVSRVGPLPILIGATSLPYLLAAGYLFFIPVQWPTPVGIRFAPSDVFVVLYCGLLAARIRQPNGSWSVWHVLLPFVLLVGLLVSLVSEGFVTAYAAGQKVIGMLVLLATYAMFLDVGRWPDNARRAIRLLIGVTAAHSAFALLAFVLGRWGILSIGWINYGGIRLAGLLIDPNAFGGLLALVLTLHLTLQKSREPLFGTRPGRLITFLLCAGLLLTFSRSAWLGFSLVLGCWALVRREAVRSFLAVAVLSCVLAIAMFGVGFLGFAGFMALRPEQFASRMDLLREAAEMFATNPVLGGGTGVFLAQHGEIVHSTAAWLMADTGLVGLFAFAGFAFWFVLRGISSYRRSEGSVRDVVLALLLGHLAMLGISFGIEALYQRHWWVVLALLVATTPREWVPTREG